MEVNENNNINISVESSNSNSVKSKKYESVDKNNDDDDDVFRVHVPKVIYSTKLNMEQKLKYNVDIIPGVGDKDREINEEYRKKGSYQEVELANKQSNFNFDDSKKHVGFIYKH